MAEIKTLESTPRSDFENSIHNEETYHSGRYAANTGVADIISTPAPLPEEKPMPTTGCFGHLPEDHHDVSKVSENNNNVQEPQLLTDPIPPEFNSHHGRFLPNQNYPHYPYYPHHNHWSPWRRQMGFNGPQFYSQQNQMYPNNPWQQWRQQMSFNGPQFYSQLNQMNSNNPWQQWRQQMGFNGPQMYSNNPWQQWRRPMSVMGPQQNQFYPNNPWSPWRRHSMPFVGPQMSPQIFPQNHNGEHPLVIVKLLQPIILPVAKPYFPEGGARDPDSEDVESQRYVNRGQHHGFHKYNHHNRFAMERMRSFERPMPVRKAIPNEFGPFKLNGAGENIQISVKLN